VTISFSRNTLLRVVSWLVIPGWKGPLRKIVLRWEDDIKVHLKGTRY